MADGHLCYSVTVTASKVQELLEGKSYEKAKDFKCGSCSKTFTTLCMLHFHLMLHCKGGSYFFDHVTRTVFPRPETVCRFTQVETDLYNELRKDEVEFENFLFPTTRKNNLPSCDDAHDEGSMMKGIPFTVPDFLPENKFETRQEEKGNTSRGKQITKDQVDRKPVVTGDFRDRDGNMVNNKTCLVKIRNIQQTQDGTISFEIDEKNADLFEVTASAILERMQREGVDWIEQDEIQMKVPVKMVELNTFASKDSTKAGVINEEENKFKMSENLATEAEKSAVKKGKIKKRQKIIKEKDLRNEMMEECFQTVCNTQDELAKSNFGIDVKEDENDGEEVDISSSNRRSSRKRTVSSRLKDAIWDSPLKQKYHKQLTEDSKRNQKRMKEDNKEEFETRLIDNEIKNIQVTGKGSPITSYEQTSEQSDATNTDKFNDEVNTENTCQADISASEVLLSLSKGNNQENGNKGSNEQDIYSESQVSKIAISRRGRRPRKTKYKSDTEESDDNFSDEEKPKKLRTNRVPANKRKDYECPTCGKLGTLATMKYHEQCHSKEKLFTCEVCGKGFKTRPCLVAHKRQHGEWKFKCDQCPAKFYRKQYLTSHLLTHTGELPHVCTQCNKGFREAYILQRHINNVHKDIRNYPCDLCDRMFFRPETRDNHRVRHFEPTLRCAYCLKMFKAELDRRKHELTHTGEKQFFCPKCSGGFTQLWPYYRHMWKKHNIGKDEAKKIRIKNKDIVSMRNIKRKDPEPVVEVTPDNQHPQTIQIYLENVVEEENDIEQNQEPVNILYGTKFIPDLSGSAEAEFKQEQITVQNDEQVSEPIQEYVCQSSEEFVSQSNEELVSQSGEDVVIQSTSDTSQVAVDLKGMYDHYYVPEGSNIVLSGKIDDRTFMMETRQDNPDSEISIVQQNVVILSEYPAMEGTYSEIEGYTKEYNSLEI